MVVDAMFIVFLLFFSIELTFTINITSNCFFDQQYYSSSVAIRNQIESLNQTSILLRAAFNYPPSSQSPSTFQLGLIYTFSDSYTLVPFPVVFNCTNIVQSCQLKTIAGTTTVSRDSEPIRISLTPFNYTGSNTIQMGLYLRQGRYQLSNCTSNNGTNITDSGQIFTIDIQYERSIGRCADSSLHVACSRVIVCLTLIIKIRDDD